ncbi:MAG: hypothetical protein GY821_04610, partial [Gammaproteobacteria bacterium]|nr:hypothetical protein [Gammaproteobacteria bacterium]
MLDYALNFLHYLNPVRGVVYLIWRFSYKGDSEEFAESCLEMKVKLFSYTLGAIKVFTSAGMYWLLASLVLAHFFPPVAVLYIGCGIFALANGYVAKKTRFRSILAKVYLLFEPTTNAREIEIQIHFKVMMRRGIFVSAIFASVAAGFSGYLGGYSLIVVFGLVGLSGPFAPIALGVLLFLFAAASVTAYLCFQAATAYDNRVESALTEPTLSHHGTCDVAYRGFKLAFNKTKNFALLGLGCYSMP